MAQTEFAANGLSSNSHPALTIDASAIHDEDGVVNGADGPDGELSPSLRRSTRASALKAQERLKLKDGIDGMPARSGSRASDVDELEDLAGVENLKKEKEEPENGEEAEESAAKRRKLHDGSALDQFRHNFGIKVEGDMVYELSDGSEISSLHESEVDALRKSYDKLIAKELTEEQRAERLRLVRAAENELRHEEAKLTMLKRIKLSQNMPNPATAAKIQEAAKKLAGISSNTNGTAYKPAVATPLNNKATNGKTATPNHAALQAMSTNLLQAMAKNPIFGLNALTTQQQAELQRAMQLNPVGALQALMAATKASGGGGLSAQQTAALAALLQQQQAAAATSAATTTSLASSQSSAQSAAQKTLSQQTPQQRIATARLAFRRQADQTLMQIPAPKAPPCDFTFIPNGAQPDFCYLLGLDLAVQKVLKDKQVTKGVTEPPYECEECGTDYTPSWKAIGGDSGDENDLHLYCEGCVRAAQKKKVRQDHMALLKKAFAKVNAQEKEFEKAIADGKLDAVLQQHLAAATAASSGGASSSSATPSGTLSASNSAANLASLAAATGSPAAALAAAAAAAMPHNLSTKSHSSGVGIASTSASASATALAAAASALQKSATAAPPRTGTASSASKTPSSSSGAGGSSGSGQKRSSSSSSTNAQNAAMQAQLQQFAQLARMAGSNPMVAAMMGPNPNLAAMFNTMQMNFMAVQAAQAAQAQAARGFQNMANPMAAMNLLAQAAQQSSSQGSAAANQQAQAAQMAQMAAAFNPAAMASLLANPQLLRQMQQMAGRGMGGSGSGKK